MNKNEGDKLIAEFMGCYGDTHFVGNERVLAYGFKDTHITDRWHESDFAERLPYHSSWNLLIPACEKFDDLDTKLMSHQTIVSFDSHVENVGKALISYDIHKVWDRLTGAITWYNELNKTS